MKQLVIFSKKCRTVDQVDEAIVIYNKTAIPALWLGSAKVATEYQYINNTKPTKKT